MEALVKVEKLEMKDPILEIGSLRTAKSLITNPTGKEFTYFLDLYLDVIKVASASGHVTIPAFGSLNVDFTLRMPLTEATYHVYLDAYVGTELLKHYQATEDVTLQAVKNWYCPYCYVGFDFTQELVWHILQEHYETVQPIQITWV